MQYLQNKVHQHHKWQQHKSWISCPDCQGAQDKQRMQYLLIPKSKWKMLQNYRKIQNRNVQIFGFVYLDTNGQNHGPVWKTQSFLLSEICTVILWQDCYGKGNLRKSNTSTIGRRFPMEKVYSYTVKKCYSCLERKKTLIRCGKYSIKKLIWENQHLSYIMKTGMYSKTMWNNQRYCWQVQNHESRISAGATEKLPCSENLRISSWSSDMEGHAMKCV